jgi:hypothetical protein
MPVWNVVGLFLFNALRHSIAEVYYAHNESLEYLMNVT